MPTHVRKISRRFSTKPPIDLIFPTVLVANMKLRTPDIPSVSTIQVPGGADVADEYIIENLSPGDFVITADVPFAAKAVEKGALGIDPRGEVLYRGKRGRAAVFEKLHDGYALGRPRPGRPAAHGHRGPATSSLRP